MLLFCEGRGERIAKYCRYSCAFTRSDYFIRTKSRECCRGGSLLPPTAIHLRASAFWASGARVCAGPPPPNAALLASCGRGACAGRASPASPASRAPQTLSHQLFRDLGGGKSQPSIFSLFVAWAVRRPQAATDLSFDDASVQQSPGYPVRVKKRDATSRELRGLEKEIGLCSTAVSDWGGEKVGGRVGATGIAALPLSAGNNSAGSR